MSKAPEPEAPEPDAPGELAACDRREARLTEVVEGMAGGVLALDSEWRVRYANSEVEVLIGRPRSELLGQGLWQLFPAAVGSGIETTFRRAVETGEPQTVRAWYLPTLDAWYDVRASPSSAGLSVYFHDVSVHHATQELLKLSADVGERLAVTLDVDRVIEELARLVVPRLGDWSIVSVADPDGSLRDRGFWHDDIRLRLALARYPVLRLAHLDGGGGTGQAARTGKPVLFDPVTAANVATPHSERATAALLELAPASGAAIPLTRGDRVVGVLSLGRSADRPPLSDNELTVAGSIAHRAALALDNARLHATQRAVTARLARANQRLQQRSEHDRTVARSLQDAMLTLLPEPANLHLSARYLTASKGEQVGGDWYDAVTGPDGATTVMIGDVVGHDIGAAALMGQLRNMLRGFAWLRDGSPAATLAQLDRAMRDLRVATLATAVLLTIEPPAVEEGTGRWRLCWANAGHPAPLLVDPDGTAMLLDQATDLMLGVAPTTVRHDYSASALAGSTLLLYTDGLIETRDQDIDVGQDRLLAAARTHHPLETGAFLAAVLDEMVGAEPEDDVAVLAVRFDPEDRCVPPPEAGPEHR